MGHTPIYPHPVKSEKFQFLPHIHLGRHPPNKTIFSSSFSTLPRGKFYIKDYNGTTLFYSKRNDLLIVHAFACKVTEQHIKLQKWDDNSNVSSLNVCRLNVWVQISKVYCPDIKHVIWTVWMSVVQTVFPSFRNAPICFWLFPNRLSISSIFTLQNSDSSCSKYQTRPIQTRPIT